MANRHPPLITPGNRRLFKNGLRKPQSIYPCFRPFHASPEIAASTSKGLHVEADLDTNHYEKGIKVTDEQLDAVHLKKHKFHAEWNYTILPSSA